MNLTKTIPFKQIMSALTLLLFCFNALASTHAEIPLLVEVDWLVNHQHDRQLVIVDARSSDAFLQGHIPQAVNIPVADTFNPNNPTDRVANFQYIQELFRSSGIHKEDTVVIYDDTSYIDAGRVFWVFEVFGHQSVKLLNGGYPIWKKRQLPVNFTKTVRPRSNYIPIVEPRRLVTQFSMRLAVEDKNKVIIDARSPQDYSGERSIASRSGHIPRAINIPWRDNFMETDGISMLKPIPQLRQIYQDIGDKKVYTYCNKGKQSSLTYTLLRQLGKDVAHYDGSWFEWGNDPALPIVIN